MNHDSSGHRPPAYPTQSWYVAATSDEVTTSPLGRRALDTGLVLYRTSDGTAVVLEDRDAHSAYPLSLGRVEQDLIVSSYSGFAYAADGSCVRVPTQTEIPYDARVRCFPVREQDGLVWVWFAEPGLAGLRKPPSAPWLADDAWSTLGRAWTTEASFMLLHENFADITHVAVVDPVLRAARALGRAGAAARGGGHRDRRVVRAQLPAGPAGRLARSPAGRRSRDAVFAQREEGRFVSPGLWIDSWEVDLDDGTTATFRFTHAVTPVNATSTRHVWRVSRNFAPGDGDVRRARAAVH